MFVALAVLFDGSFARYFWFCAEDDTTFLFCTKNHSKRSWPDLSRLIALVDFSAQEDNCAFAWNIKLEPALAGTANLGLRMVAS